jgi:hypothetical protein
MIRPARSSCEPSFPRCSSQHAPQASPGSCTALGADVANQIQQKYDRVRDFTADFTHEAESGVLRKKLVSRARSW